MVPIVPVGFAFATEVTHPLAPALVIGMMSCAANLLLFCLDFGYVAVLNGQTVRDSRIILCVMTVEAFLALVGSFFIKEDLRRLSSVASLSMLLSTSSPKSSSRKSGKSSPHPSDAKAITDSNDQ